jgi:hypothetical protein
VVNQFAHQQIIEANYSHARSIDLKSVGLLNLTLAAHLSERAEQSIELRVSQPPRFNATNGIAYG